MPRYSRAQKRRLRMIIDIIILVLVLGIGGWVIWGGNTVSVTEYFIDTIEENTQQEIETVTVVEEPVETEAERLAKLEQKRLEELKIREKKIADEVKRRTAIRQKIKDKKARWKSYYKTPTKCLNPIAWENLVKCKNKKIIARKKFDKLYDAGKI